MSIKRIGVLAVVVAAAALMLAGSASAEMYVEGYLGGTSGTRMGQGFGVHELGPGANANYTANFPGALGVNVLGGVKVGTWFVPTGFAGYSYPDWMKYFGFYTDLSFQRLTMGSDKLNANDFRRNVGPSNIGIANSQLGGDYGFMDINGTVTTWAFMFAARYGFFPDSEVPFGRLQPYVGVGPAVMFSSIKPKIFTQWYGGTGFNGTPDLQMSPGNQGSTNIALAVDAGVRFMCLKNVSLDISFKYRYAQPTYTFASTNGVDFIPASFTLSPTLNLFSLQGGVAYHF